jgi:hypothetical protein
VAGETAFRSRINPECITPRVRRSSVVVGPGCEDVHARDINLAFFITSDHDKLTRFSVL